jgi:hypothetical protein
MTNWLMTSDASVVEEMPMEFRGGRQGAVVGPKGGTVNLSTVPAPYIQRRTTGSSVGRWKSFTTMDATTEHKRSMLTKPLTRRTTGAERGRTGALQYPR